MPSFTSAALLRVSLGLSTLSGLLLLAPWARSGRIDRSMFGLISSASALDLLSGAEKVLVVSAVVALVVAVGFSLVAAAWSHAGSAAAALIAPGPILATAAVVIARTPLTLRWGAVAGSSAGMIGSICASMFLLIGSRHGIATHDRI